MNAPQVLPAFGGQCEGGRKPVKQNGHWSILLQAGNVECTRYAYCIRALPCLCKAFHNRIRCTDPQEPSNWAAVYCKVSLAAWSQNILDLDKK